MALVLQIAHSTLEPLTWSVRTRVLTLVAQAAVTLLPFLWVGPLAGALAGFLAGSLLLAVSGGWRWWLFGAVVLAVLLGQWVEGLSAIDIGYGVYFTALTGLMIYAVSSLVVLVGLVHATIGQMVAMVVARERLRVARDLHDLLGFNVSAMMLKSELAYRLLPMTLERARQELGEVLQIADRALSDIRVVAGGDQRMSMAIEAEAARTALTCAGMRVTVEPGLSVLPEPVESVLGVVLREAATNVLRHSKAEECVIEVSVRDHEARLSVRNDGVEADSRSDGGFGLDNLIDRLAVVGGRLVASTDEGWFRLEATIPLPVGPLPPGASSADRSLGEPAAVPWHRRVARAFTVLVLAGYGLLMVINVLPGDPNVLHLLGLGLCLAAVVGLQVLQALRYPYRWPRWSQAAVLVAQAVLSALPLLWIEMPWGSMGGFLAGSLLLVFGGVWRWVSYGLVGVAVLLTSVAYGATVEQVAYLTISTLLTGLVVYGVSSLSGLVQQIDQARVKLAGEAVTQERLEVAEQLRTRLGELFSAILFRGRTAIRLLPDAPEQARAEVAEMLGIARIAASNIRTVATGYRHMSLRAELESAATVLDTAGVEVEIDIAEGELAREIDALLAVVLREAVTNIVRHSEAHTCLISVRSEGGRLRLLVTNDGASPRAKTGTSLENLTERLRAAGGDLTAAATGDTFRLVAELPIFPAASRG
ncbi:sensor histidine kinase [Micromonospora sp. NPDC048871]|uniref:sensor histidine kinase n=1 Tax=Micromonospora sp. NPDC048871 TaxID=3364259 RepID=UPI003719A7DE